MEIVSIILSILALAISLFDVFKSYIMEKFLYLTSKYDVLLFPIAELSEKSLLYFKKCMEEHGVPNSISLHSIRVVRFGFERIYGCNLSDIGIEYGKLHDFAEYINLESCIYNYCNFYIITRRGHKKIRHQRAIRV